MSGTLTRRESARRAECEAVIRAGLGTFVEVGTALAEIRDTRLYRDGFDTFDDYCREVWNLSGGAARHLITGSRITASIDAVDPGAPNPANEAQARELAGLSPAAAAATMRRAHEVTGGKLTAKAIRQARPDRKRTMPVIRRRDKKGRLQPVRKSTPAQLARRREATVTLWNQGANAQQIATALDIDVQAIYDDLNIQGVKRRKRYRGLAVDPEPIDWRTPDTSAEQEPTYRHSVTLGMWTAILNESRTGHHANRLANDAQDAEAAGDQVWLAEAAETLATAIAEATRLHQVVTDRAARLRGQREETEDGRPDLRVVRTFTSPPRAGAS